LFLSAQDPSWPFVEIHEGPISTGKIILATAHPQEILDREFTAAHGLYVRLRGAYSDMEHVAFVYTPFRTLDDTKKNFGKGTRN
jgi:hypothetical protein